MKLINSFPSIAEVKNTCCYASTHPPMMSWLAQRQIYLNLWEAGFSADPNVVWWWV